MAPSEREIPLSQASPDGETRKTELLEYIRNRQHLEEVDAARTGHTLWVVWGGILYVCIQLTQVFSPTNHLEIIGLSADLIILSVFVRYTLFSPAAYSLREKPRFLTPITHGPGDAPYLISMFSILLMLPAALAWVYGTSIVGATLLATLWLFATIMVAVENWVHRRSDDELPIPLLKADRASTSFRLSSTLYLGLGLLAIGDLVLRLYLLPWNQVKHESLEAAVYLAALYWLIFIALRLPIRLNSLGWLTRLEAELVLGGWTTEQIYANLKSRELGLDVSEVFENHTRKIRVATDTLISEILSAKDEIKTVEQIPADYTHERRERIKKANEALLEKFNAWDKVISAYVSYLKRLARLHPTRPDLDAFISKELDRMGSELARLKPEVQALSSLLSKHQKSEQS